MDDLISRQMAIKQILLCENHDMEHDFEFNEGLIVATNAVNELPIAVIMCRDCEYGEQDEEGWWFCRDFGSNMGHEDGSGFCSYGERRYGERRSDG